MTRYFTESGNRKLYMQCRVLIITLTFVRRIEKESGTYLYEVTSYRDHGRVRQRTRYLGKEIDHNGEKTLIPPKEKNKVRRVLESAGYIMFRVAEEHGFIERYQAAISGYCRIEDPAKKIVMLACESMVGSEHSIHIHTGLAELKEKEIRDIIRIVGRSDPDIIDLLERSMSPLLIQEY